MKKRVKIKKPPILFKDTQAIIAQIEKRIAGTFLSYWNSVSGSVCHDDAVGFHEILNVMEKKGPLFLFVKSDGGTGEASLRIVHVLRQHFSHVKTLVPLNCASAATMLALGTNEIHMGPLAYLSAVDTSLTHDLSPIDKDNHLVSVSQNELSRILNSWKKESAGEMSNPYQVIFQHIHPLVIGAVDRASSLSIRLCRDLLSYHMDDPGQAESISNTLNADYPSHTYPITLNEARRLGLKAAELDPELNELLLGLHKVYSEMGQRAVTDFDEANYNDNEILNIIEGRHIQLFWQGDKDWHYRKEERRWVSMNDQSSWRKVESKRGRIVQTVFHLR